MSSSPITPVIRQVSPQPQQPIAPLLFFEGGGSKKQRDHARLVNRELGRAGIDRKALRDDWNAVLWRAFFKDKRAVLTFDAAGKGKLDMKGLEGWVKERMGRIGYDSVKVLQRSLGKCCDKACKSCINGNKTAKKDWIG